MSWRSFPYNKPPPLPTFQWALDTVHSPLPGVMPYIQRLLKKIIVYPIKVIIYWLAVWDQVWFQPLRPGRSKFRHEWFDFGDPGHIAVRDIDDEVVNWERSVVPTIKNSTVYGALSQLYDLPELQQFEIPPIAPKNDRYNHLRLVRYFERKPFED